ALRDGKIKVLFAMGGNLVAAVSDTHAAEQALQNADLTVQVSTKLNRSHAVVGKAAMILPVLGRSEIDVQDSGPQILSVEDTVAAVHQTEGKLTPVAPNLLSEISVVSRLARATLGDGGPVDWSGFERN